MGLKAMLAVGVVVASPALAADTIRYHYDALGRLVSSDRRAQGGNGARSDYLYDRASNRTRVISTGAFKPVSLTIGMELKNSEGVLSNDKRFLFIFQNDSNIVVYQDDMIPIWSPHTEGSGAVRAVFQSDGNFVLYRADGSAVWHTNTSGKGGTRLTMLDDGNLVMYTASGQPVWYTGTCCR